MALSDLYITAVDLEEYFVDKDTGLPLAGGQIQFWVDGARTTPKLVYELTGDPTNSQGGGYSYAPLPNPITLSDVGTVQDSNGNNTPIYYYPYDSNGQLQLYYIVVVNSLGVVQFTREAWPNVTLTQVAGASESISANQISNGQFSVMSLPGGLNSQVISFTGVATNLYYIAPGWVLSVGHNGAGTVTVTRTALTGSSGYPTNPNYWLTVTPGANVTSLILYQRFDSPSVWSQTNNGGDGWISASVALDAGSSLEIKYVPSSGTATSILAASNATIVPNTSAKTVQLPVSNNASTPNTGYVDIQLILPVGQPTTFSSVQIVSMNVNLGNVPYIQDAPERQQVYALNTYLPSLLYKPTKSFLVGWDFPLNPAQFGEALNPLPVNNSSAYAWDQTIVYSSGNNAVKYSRAPSGAFRLSGLVASSVAVIQYISQRQAREILNQSVSVMVAATTDNATPIASTVSLFWTDGTALPNLGAGTSIVASLNASGNVATVNNPTAGTWNRISPASGLGATFQLGTAASGFNYYDFNDFTLGQGAGGTTATFAAIVVGFGNLPVGQNIDINSISLVPGAQATIPAAQSYTEVLNECRHFYWKSYLSSDAPGTVTDTGKYILPANLVWNSITGRDYYYPASFIVNFPQPMHAAPVYNFYNPAGTVDTISNVMKSGNGAGADVTLNYATTGGTPQWTFAVNVNNLAATYIPFQVGLPDTGGTSGSDSSMHFHIVCDARLGLV